MDVKKTGEHADKTVAELKKELNALKAKSQKIQDSGKKVPKSIVDQEAELKFAIRAKQGWKEKTEAKKINESELKVKKYVRAKLEELAGLKKPRLNESAKSTSLKKLDEMIETEYNKSKKK